MYQVEDKPETIHLYVVREGPARPSLAPIILSLFTLSLLIVLGIAVPYKQPVTRLALRVPAVPLTIKSFSASVAIVPTGVRTYAATTAHGILTITNGSIIAQIIPAGFTVQGVVTDGALYVPPGNADGYGRATVLAHTLITGAAGNLPPLAINQVIGSSVYIRNLSAFHGGHDSYSVRYVTEQDRQTALTQARSRLAAEVIGLHYPCQETKYTSIYMNVYIFWHCQFFTYQVPSYMHISAVHLSGKNLIVAVWFIAPVKRIWVN
jgi:hypothetical protein